MVEYIFEGYVFYIMGKGYVQKDVPFALLYKLMCFTAHAFLKNEGLLQIHIFSCAE